jgi:gas vesicle protein
MRRLLAFFGGVLGGGAIGTVVALLFTPASGDRLRRGVRQRYQGALEAGQAAADQKRQELEAQLVAMTGPHAPDSPLLNRDRPPAR